MNEVLLNAFWCVGVHILLVFDFSILRPVGWQLERLLPDWMAKPLFTCPVCMSSVHGILFLSFFKFSAPNWALHIGALVAFNALLVGMIYKLFPDQE